MEGVLVLEDGSVIKGQGFGSERTIFGELVFNTSMTGYQETLTDPSYNGQILMMTYPLIGNYGINSQNFESDKIQPEGFVVREVCSTPSHRTSSKTLDMFLKEFDIPGIAGIDTRMLTIKTRKYGTLRAALSTNLNDSDINELLKKVQSMPYPDKYNLVEEVSCKEIKTYEGAGQYRVVLIDCGVKKSIRNHLLKNCDVIQVPYNINSDELRGLKPHGILISNGPGDPAHPEIIDTVVKTVREVVNEYPIMGICLGHQILALVFGASTYKLKFGHRGANQPVKNFDENKVYITSQNHGFAVDPSSCPSELVIVESNVNDATVEALRHKELPIFSIQYHPEASPGPRDTHHLFDKFIALMGTTNA